MGTLKPYVVIPNWNGAHDLPKCLDSLLDQTLSCHIIVVDNGSTDGSLELLKKEYPEVEVLVLAKNHGFAGGVNTGAKKALEDGAKYVALLNNDAPADKKWLESLVEKLEQDSKLGIATSKILSVDSIFLDSTGDYYTIWGLPYPRGRNETGINKYDSDTVIFGASGGASLYRTEMLKEIGLFDEDFFAYYEDVDLSFRAQLGGWKVAYAPKAIVYHQIGATSGKIKGFTTYQTLKNLPLLMWKNVPARLMLKVFPRFVLAYFMFWGRALSRGQVWPSTKGVAMSILLWPKKLVQRYKIQKYRKVSVDYIDSLIVHDLPPNAHNLRSLRAKWWKLLRKKPA
jgi:GT2 family glycosyltransferase